MKILEQPTSHAELAWACLSVGEPWLAQAVYRASCCTQVRTQPDGGRETTSGNGVNREAKGSGERREGRKAAAETGQWDSDWASHGGVRGYVQRKLS